MCCVYCWFDLQILLISKFIFPRHWRSNDHIWQFRKILSHLSRDTDDPTTIYGNSGNFRHTFSVTLTIPNDHVWLISDTTENFRVTQELVRLDVRFLSLILVKWPSNETLTSVGWAWWDSLRLTPISGPVVWIIIGIMRVIIKLYIYIWKNL